MATVASLNGMGVLVTRPEHQAETLCQLIERHGGLPVRCPALQIAEPRDWTPALALFERLADYDLAIFTSANAVERALAPIRQQGGLPAGLEIAAVGQATARTLARSGVASCLRPETDFSSEGLLALPRFHAVAGQSVLIVRGEGGRALLADTLAARGARVSVAEVYRRERPAADTEALLARWARGGIGAAVVASTETLLNLFDMLNGAGQDYLRDTPVIAPSVRTRHAAARHGFRRLLVARNASDEAFLAALLDLAANSFQFRSVTRYDR